MYQDPKDVEVLSRIARAPTENRARYGAIFPHDTVPDERRYARLKAAGLVESYDPGDVRPLAGPVLRLTESGRAVLDEWATYVKDIGTPRTRS